MVVFVVIGVVTVLLGQIIPLLTVRLSLSDAEAGTFFLAQFSGGLIGTLMSGPLVRRIGFVVTLLVGLGIIIAGVPAVAFPDFWACWCAIFIYGMGLGLTTPAANLLTIEITEPQLQARALNLMNFAWGLGAIVCQPFIAATATAASVMPALLLLVFFLGIASLLLFSIRSSEPSHYVDSEPSAPYLWKAGRPWMFAAFVFVCIGIESGLSGWLTTYSNTLRSSLNIAFVFFLSFVTGRAIASAISKQISENSLITVGIALLFFGAVLLAVAATPPIAILGSIFAGLGSSPIFPTHMVRFAKTFGPSATRNAIPIFIAGILGSASVSGLVGVVSTEFGGMSKGIVVILIAAVALIAIQAFLLASSRRI